MVAKSDKGGKGFTQYSDVTYSVFYNDTSQYVCRIPIGNPIQKSYILRSSQISDIASKRNFWTYKLI